MTKKYLIAAVLLLSPLATHASADISSTYHFTYQNTGHIFCSTLAADYTDCQDFVNANAGTGGTVTVSGTASNNGTFTVSDYWATSGNYTGLFDVAEPLTNEGGVNGVLSTLTFHTSLSITPNPVTSNASTTYTMTVSNATGYAGNASSTVYAMYWGDGSYNGLQGTGSSFTNADTFDNNFASGGHDYSTEKGKTIHFVLMNYDGNAFAGCGTGHIECTYSAALASSHYLGDDYAWVIAMPPLIPVPSFSDLIASITPFSGGMFSSTLLPGLLIVGIVIGALMLGYLLKTIVRSSKKVAGGGKRRGTYKGINRRMLMMYDIRNGRYKR